MFSERKVDVEARPVEDGASAAFGRFNATAHDLSGVVDEAWFENRVEGDAPDVLSAFRDGIDTEINVGVLKTLETVIGRRLAGFRQVKREPHPRAAALDHVLTIGRPVESAGIALRQTGGDPARKKMRIGIDAEPGTAPCRVGVHVHQSRQKQRVGVIELKTRGTLHVGTGCDNPVAPYGDGARPVLAGFRTKNTPGPDQQVKGVGCCGHVSFLFGEGCVDETGYDSSARMGEGTAFVSCPGGPGPVVLSNQRGPAKPSVESSRARFFVVSVNAEHNPVAPGQPQPLNGMAHHPRTEAPGSASLCSFPLLRVPPIRIAPATARPG